jgi:hypothetical protein
MLFCCAAVASRTFKINHKKIVQAFPVDFGFDCSIESVAKLLGQPLC